VLGRLGIGPGTRVANTLAGALATPGALLLGDVHEALGALDVPLGTVETDAAARAAWGLIDRGEGEGLVLEPSTAAPFLGAAPAAAWHRLARPRRRRGPAGRRLRRLAAHLARGVGGRQLRRRLVRARPPARRRGRDGYGGGRGVGPHAARRRRVAGSARHRDRRAARAVVCVRDARSDAGAVRVSACPVIVPPVARGARWLPPIRSPPSPRSSRARSSPRC